MSQAATPYLVPVHGSSRRAKTFIGAARAVGDPKDATTEAIVCFSSPFDVAVPFALTSDAEAPLECPSPMEPI